MSPRSLALLFDPPDEGWPSMELAGEMLMAHLRAEHEAAFEPSRVDVRIPRLARRVPRLGPRNAAFNVDRMAARFVTYPAHARAIRGRYDLFHLVDHSYAQLVHALDASRTGVFCHDLDTFRCLLQPEVEPRPAWFRAMARLILRGLQSAAVVFHTTNTVRDQILRHGVLPASRLVQAPYGVSPEFDATPRDDDGARELLAPIGGRRFVLHVGSAIPRKRLDVLFAVFARLHRADPELRLVQQGADFTPAQKAQIAELRIEGAIHQPVRGALDRKRLAGIYRRAALVLAPSEAEGFGFPVIEALACGAPVLASDIPVFREVAADAAQFAPLADADAWAAVATRLLDGSLAPPPRDARLARAALYRWSRHAATIADAYRAVADRRR